MVERSVRAEMDFAATSEEASLNGTARRGFDTKRKQVISVRRYEQFISTDFCVRWNPFLKVKIR